MDYVDLREEPARIDSPKAYYPQLCVKESVLIGRKIGETGEATIRYSINGHGIEVLAIKFNGSQAVSRPGEGNSGGYKSTAKKEAALSLLED